MNIVSLLIAAGIGYGTSFHSSAPIAYPLFAERVTSFYGHRIHPISKQVEFHRGIDFSAKEGETIHAIGLGQVIFAGLYSGYGNLVVIKHGDRLTSHYAHCQKLTVRVGDVVTAGQDIGLIGHSGRATSPHLHFEIRLNGYPIDPTTVFPGLLVASKG